MPWASTLHRAVSVRAAFVTAALAGLCSIGEPAAASAQTPAIPPVRAAVFIRVIGDLDLVRPPDQPGGERHVQETNVELSTGSGVLISPAGHVLTAAHVVAPDTRTVTVSGIRIEVRQTVRKIEVLLPGDEAGQALPPLDASLLASDAALDLAVVSVNGPALPFLDLGDSDALAIGESVEAVGFPFGEDVEVGRPRAAETVAPAPSVSRGNLSAYREDGQGDRRFIQVTAPLNAGNSGGPIVDADGYVVAIASRVIRSRGSGATGVGFGVSVNVAKRFLEAYGLDAVLRARRVVAGPPSGLDGKALRLSLLVGTSDTSPGRARVDAASQAADGIVLHVDRVVSPWTPERLAEALVTGRAFEAFTPSSAAAPRVVEAARGRLLLGRATGSLDDGTPARMEYAIAEAGAEKLVARFVGAPHQVAFNASVLRAALRLIEMDPLRAPSRALGGPIAWVPVAPPRRTGIDGLRLPARWVVEAAAPSACRGVPAPADVVSASPASDFAVALRAGWLPSAGVPPAQAAAACGHVPADDAAAYVRDDTFLGTAYHVEGRFVAAGDGLLQLESIAPLDQALAMRPIFLEWAGGQ